MQTFQEQAKEAAIAVAKERRASGHSLSYGGVVVSDLDFDNKPAIADIARMRGRPEEDVRNELMLKRAEARRAGKLLLHAEWLDPDAIQRRAFHGGHNNSYARWFEEPPPEECFRLVMLYMADVTSAIVGLDGYWHSAHDE